MISPEQQLFHQTQLFHLMSSFPHTSLPWINQQLKISPPSSPSTLCPSSAWGSRYPSNKVTSFTIDAILGTQKQNMEKHLHSSDLRMHRMAPYPVVTNTGVNNLQRNYNNSDNTNNSSSNTNIGVSGAGGGGKSAKTKRIRTIFTAEQLEKLESEFARQQYMVGPERVYLASTLQLTEAQVKVWFQNRRIKWRKQYIETQPRYPSNSSENTPSSSPSPPSASPTNIQSLDSSDAGDSSKPNGGPSRCSSPDSSDYSRSPSPPPPPSATCAQASINTTYSNKHYAQENTIQSHISDEGTLSIKRSLSDFVQINNLKSNLFSVPVQNNSLSEQHTLPISIS